MCEADNWVGGSVGWESGNIHYTSIWKIKFALIKNSDLSKGSDSREEHFHASN